MDRSPAAHLGGRTIPRTGTLSLEPRRRVGRSSAGGRDALVAVGIDEERDLLIGQSVLGDVALGDAASMVFARMLVVVSLEHVDDHDQRVGAVVVVHPVGGTLGD